VARVHLPGNHRLAGDNVADPEQIYQEVLAEEQQKGSSPPVAEGRAKAARQRATEGSPHPKEPKWWPGSQPHFEGGGAAEDAAPAPEAEAEPEPAPEPEPEPAAPAAEAPATATPVAESPPADAGEVQQDAPAAPATPAPVQPEAPAAAPAAAAATEVQPAAAAPSRPAGVTHGTTTGTRLRPEDEVTTDAQFDAQQALHDRRKLIDDLVATGVPVVTAADAGRTRAPLLVLLYLLIPLVAVMYLVSQSDGPSEATETPTGQESEAPGNITGDALEVTSVDLEFDTDQLTVPADKPFTITLQNDDSVLHNLSIYDGDSAEADIILKGRDAAPEGAAEQSVDGVPKGSYYFQCDYHPSMAGTLTAE
jgi:plastocyanin